MTLNKIYKLKGNCYDEGDLNVYYVKIMSGPVLNFLKVFYEAEEINFKQRVWVYPDDWESIQELTPLEEELL